MSNPLRWLVERQIIGKVSGALAKHRLAEQNARKLAAAIAEGKSAHVTAAVPERPAGQPSFAGSIICNEAHFADPWYGHFCHGLGEIPRFHRKQWEFVFICAALDRNQALAPGKRGLGFGVGIEPLPAYFASRGCRVLATDMGRQRAVQIGWANTREHAADGAELNQRGTCPPELFAERVRMREVDMNYVPQDLAGFDFCWSACALEHLGSIELGMRFVERSLATLAPGGVAVHTTEYNLWSNDDTLDHHRTVIPRRRDFEALQRRLEAQGHRVEPYDFTQGEGVLDGFIDMPPYQPNPHLRVLLERHASTSIGLVIKRAS